MIRSLRRWLYVARTFRDYGERLNRSVDVEIELAKFAAGKREHFTREEARQLANKLGVPTHYK